MQGAKNFLDNIHVVSEFVRDILGRLLLGIFSVVQELAVVCGLIELKPKRDEAGEFGQKGEAWMEFDGMHGVSSPFMHNLECPLTFRYLPSIQKGARPKQIMRRM